MSKQFRQQFKPLTKPEEKEESSLIENVPKQSNANQVADKIIDKSTVKIAAEIPAPLNEKLIAYHYWERTNNNRLLTQLIEDFLSDKDIAPLPEEERQKKRPGRKPKTSSRE